MSAATYAEGGIGGIRACLLSDECFGYLEGLRAAENVEMPQHKCGDSCEGEDQAPRPYRKAGSQEEHLVGHHARRTIMLLSMPDMRDGLARGIDKAKRDDHEDECGGIKDG